MAALDRFPSITLRHPGFGPVPRGASVEIWRDDDDAAELNMLLQLDVTVGSETRSILAELPKLYKVRWFKRIPVVKRRGVLAEINPYPIDPFATE